MASASGFDYCMSSGNCQNCREFPSSHTREGNVCSTEDDFGKNTAVCDRPIHLGGIDASSNYCDCNRPLSNKKGEHTRLVPFCNSFLYPIMSLLTHGCACQEDWMLVFLTYMNMLSILFRCLFLSNILNGEEGVRLQWKTGGKHRDLPPSVLMGHSHISNFTVSFDLLLNTRILKTLPKWALRCTCFASFCI